MQKKAASTEMVAFPSGAERINGFLALPADTGLYWGIIAIHEWWGLNEWMKKQARSLAANGYVVLAVDLYRGKVAAERAQARKLKRGVPEDRAIRDLKSAFDFLAAHPEVNPEGIGSIGWSMGGCFALQLAIQEPRLAACVVNYGLPPTNPREIQKINAPVLGNFGELDRSVPLRSVRVFEKVMKMLNKSVDIKIYAGAGHAFANPDSKRGYRPEATVDMWSRTLTFYARAKESKNQRSGTASLAKR